MIPSASGALGEVLLDVADQRRLHSAGRCGRAAGDRGLSGEADDERRDGLLHGCVERALLDRRLRPRGDAGGLEGQEIQAQLRAGARVAEGDLEHGVGRNLSAELASGVFAVDLGEGGLAPLADHGLLGFVRHDLELREAGELAPDPVPQSVTPGLGDGFPRRVLGLLDRDAQGLREVALDGVVDGPCAPVGDEEVALPGPEEGLGELRRLPGLREVSVRVIDQEVGAPATRRAAALYGHHRDPQAASAVGLLERLPAGDRHDAGDAPIRVELHREEPDPGHGKKGLGIEPLLGLGRRAQGERKEDEGCDPAEMAGRCRRRLGEHRHSCEGQCLSNTLSSMLIAGRVHLSLHVENACQLMPSRRSATMIASIWSGSMALERPSGTYETPGEAPIQ